MKKIRIAQIGINILSHSTEIFHTIKTHPEVFELVGYALVEDERETCSHKLSELDGYPELTLDEILNDESIEAVAVETDEIHLTKYALMAAEHGKHIHMEKPGSQDLADFERLISLMRASGKVLHLGYMYRYNPYISSVIERVRAGELGEIFSTETHMSRLDIEKWRAWLSNFKGGMMFYLGCHLIDLVMQIQGVPEQVLPFNTSTGFNGVTAEDNSLALMKYPRGYSIVRVSGAEVGGFERRQLVVMGERGTIEIRPLEGNLPQDERKTRFAHFTSKREARFDENGEYVKSESTSEQYDRYTAMILAFGEMVRGEKSNPYTLDSELELYKVILKCCGM